MLAQAAHRGGLVHDDAGQAFAMRVVARRLLRPVITLWSGDSHTSRYMAAPLVALFTVRSARTSPFMVLNRAIEARKDAIQKTLPEFLDMVASTVQAGLALNSALAYAVEASPGPLGEEIREALAEIRLGRSRAEALKAAGERTNQPDLRNALRVMTQAERLGANIAKLLIELAEDARHQRLMLVEEMAAKLPVKMVFPMVFFMIPSIFTIIFGTVAANYFAPTTMIGVAVGRRSSSAALRSRHRVERRVCARVAPADDGPPPRSPPTLVLVAGRGNRRRRCWSCSAAPVQILQRRSSFSRWWPAGAATRAAASFPICSRWCRWPRCYSSRSRSAIGVRLVGAIPFVLFAGGGVVLARSRHGLGRRQTRRDHGCGARRAAGPFCARAGLRCGVIAQRITKAARGPIAFAPYIAAATGIALPFGMLR